MLCGMNDSLGKLSLYKQTKFTDKISDSKILYLAISTGLAKAQVSIIPEPVAFPADLSASWCILQ
jgi:hypothetical protein